MTTTIGTDYLSWRDEPTIGGFQDSHFERAFPGMPSTGSLSMHIMRYAFATMYVNGQDVLDLGCGTGYGSELLSWAASRVRGFDLWQPSAAEEPRWPGVAEFRWGHDLCTAPLPAAEWAVWFENIEHLPRPVDALRSTWASVDGIVCSFPNPVYQGSHINPHHVTDWTLDEFEHELRSAARERFADVEMEHFHQLPGTHLITPGRNPEAIIWIVVARGVHR